MRSVLLSHAALLMSPSRSGKILPAMKDCEEVVRVIHVPSSRPGEYLQIYLDALDQKGIGFFGQKESRD